MTCPSAFSRIGQLAQRNTPRSTPRHLGAADLGRDRETKACGTKAHAWKAEGKTAKLQHLVTLFSIDRTICSFCSSEHHNLSHPQSPSPPGNHPSRWSLSKQSGKTFLMPGD